MNWVRLRPLEVVERSLVPVMEVEPWGAALHQKLAAGSHPVTLFGENESDGSIRVWCVLGESGEQVLWVTSARMEKYGPCFESLANDFPAINYFECELFEQTGIIAQNHPWLRPVRTADHWRKNGEQYNFYRVEGEE